jgi:hypothetical protein
MTLRAALQMQIERYRQMTGEQRLALALELHELSCRVAREGTRHQHPQATPKQVERRLQRRLELARKLFPHSAFDPPSAWLLRTPIADG